MKHRLPKPKTARRKEPDSSDYVEESLLVEPAAAAQPPPLLAHPHEAPVTHDEIAPGEALIQTRGLVKQYGGRRVVNGVDIHVRAGEVVGLLGKNGAGKTTTFYMIVGLVPPTEGHVFMGEEDVTRMPMYRRARRGIGYLPQEESIFRKLSVEENLLAILETLPMSEEERERRCDELLRDFGLEHVRENIAITLSGGEKRRVTIARALVTQPSLLLLDEPFSGVDPMAVHDIQEIILHLKERGLGVLITDHNVRETLSVVDRAYIIDEGRVLSEGTRDFLLNDPVAREIYLGHRFTM
jgi:lipopolysaccharide export system ATP-binding protein